MKKYKSHKIVEAVKIKSWKSKPNTKELLLQGEDGETYVVPAGVFARYIPKQREDFYLVKYSDDHFAYSPVSAFEEGYTPLDVNEVPGNFAFDTGREAI